MTQTEITLKLETYKMGTYLPITYLTKGENGTYKIVSSVVRIINPIRVENPSRTIKINHIDKFLIETKNGSVIIHLFGSKGKYHKSKINYFNGDGEEIDKETYESAQKPKRTYGENPQQIFSKRIEDIIELGR